jgi:uncharacterized repeat protein (TIGR02543 family)
VEYADEADFTKSAASNTTLFAVWEANTYYVIFDANEGTGTMDNQTIVFGVTEALNENEFTRVGYTFEGWSTSATGEVEYADEADFTKTVAENTTLYAIWEANTHNVIFDGNGATSGTMNNQPFVFGQSFALEQNQFTRIGHTFIGWAISPMGIIVFADEATISAGVDDDVTLYAVWEANTYYVIFDANEGTGTMANQPIVFEATEALNENEFTRIGYTFEGWSTSATGEVEYADEADFTKSVAENTTLFAVWEEEPANTYQIIFNANGGTGTMANQSIVLGATEALNENKFTRVGYTFEGWSTSATGEVEYADEADFTKRVAENTTLFAVWEEDT